MGFITKFASPVVVMTYGLGAMVAAMLSSPAAAEPPMPDIGYGNDLLTACVDQEVVTKAICAAYINGVADAANQMHLICLPSGVTHGQAMDVVVKGLRENPAERHKLSATLTLSYLMQAFPCGKAAG